MIYSPAEDSFLLKSYINKYAFKKSVLDMGSGSGILALAAKDSGAKSVLAIDISEEVIQNLKKLKIPCVKSDLFSKVSGKFDLIIFNPPYLPKDPNEDLDSSLITSGGENGDEIILRFIKESNKHLSSKGVILILLSSLTPKEKILDLLEKKGLVKKLLIQKKFFFETLEVWEIKSKGIKSHPNSDTNGSKINN